MERPNKDLSRRQFLNQSIRGASACVAGGVALATLARAAKAGGDSSVNPFSYDVERASRVDPGLIKYEQVKRLSGLAREPRRIAAGPGDSLYIATSTGVDILHRTGAKLAQISTASAARCVAAAEDGTVYIGLRTHVEVFDRQGRQLSTWEAPTKKTWFTGLCVGANDVFAADSANRVVFRYDRSGKLAGRIGEKSQERNIPGLIVPSPYLDVKLGLDGLLRVNNPGRHSVQVFTPAGDLEFSWGKPSLAVDGFCGCCNPVGLALFSDGRCVTCEKGVPRVKVYSAERSFESVVAGPELFRENGRPGQVSDRSDGTLGGLDATVDSQGNVYILDLVAGDVRVMKPKA